MILEMLPRWPSKVSVTAVQERLQTRGHATSVRNVQRDLNELSLTHPLRSDNRRPQGWGWAANARPLVFPAHDEHTRLALALAKRSLTEILPPATLAALKPLLAETGPQAGDRSLGARNPMELVQVHSRYLTLTPPAIEARVQKQVALALVQGHQLKVKYRSRSKGRTSEWIVHPLGLIVTEGICYLVATVENYTDVRHLALHRIASAAALEATASRPKGFSLRAYLAAGGMEVRKTDKPFALRLRIRPERAVQLEEARLSADQVVIRRDGQWTEVRATVPDSLQLRWWLRSIGPDLEVLEPEGLREEFRDAAFAAAAMYQTEPLFS